MLLCEEYESNLNYKHTSSMILVHYLLCLFRYGMRFELDFDILVIHSSNFYSIQEAIKEDIFIMLHQIRSS